MFEPKGIQLIGTIATAIDRHLKRSQFVQDSVVDPGI
jgi:hypothetical protein